MPEYRFELEYGLLVGNTTNVLIANVVTGNVTIGRSVDSTVGQGVKLDVAGGINASAVLVNGAAITADISPAFNQANAAYAAANAAGGTLSTKIVTTDYAILSADGLIVTNSTGLINITLPNAVTTNAKTYIVKSINTGTVTILRSDADLIDGSANLVIKTRYSAVNFISLGTGGWVVT